LITLLNKVIKEVFSYVIGYDAIENPAKRRNRRNPLGKTKASLIPKPDIGFKSPMKGSES